MTQTAIHDAIQRSPPPRLFIATIASLLSCALCMEAAARPLSEGARLLGPVSSPEALNEEAVARFKAKDFEGAIDLFEQAYAVDPKPNYLFNIGRVYEEAGKLSEAAEYYQRFAREPGVDLESREFALNRLRVIRAVLAETASVEAPAAPTTAPAEPQPAVTTEPPPSDEAAKRRRLRIAGFSLLGIGGVAAAVGGGLGGLALRQSRELTETDGYLVRQELIEAGKTNAAIADGLFIAGGVLAISGLVLVLTTLRPRPKAEARALAPTIGPRHAGLVWQGRF